MTYDPERRLTSWQNAPSSPTGQIWMLYDGEGHRVEQYTSGGSGSHTYYLPDNASLFAAACVPWLHRVH